MSWFIFDLPAAMVKLYDIWKDNQRAQAWARLIFSMAFSAIVAFCGTSGLALMSGQGFFFSLGAGLVAVATALLSLFLKSNLTRGMTISVPVEIVEKHQGGNGNVTIVRN